MPVLPELTKLPADWRWLFDPADFELLQVSLFGDLLLRDRAGIYRLLDVNAGELAHANVASNDPVVLFPIAFDIRLATPYIEAGLIPKEGECFGFKIPLVVEGPFDVSNAYIAKVTEYVSFLGDIHRQIQHLPDGTKVKINVI